MTQIALKRIFLIILVSFLAYPALALANQWRAYDSASFAKAQEAGKTIFVSVHADW